MHDCPSSAEDDPQYLANVLEPLRKGEGVACFVVEDDGGPTVLYCTHVLSGWAQSLAVDDCERVRAAQALAVQREARDQAARAGFYAVVA
ncbi:MAG: hypothetical protein ACR2NB_06585 [Solirubrobacteraceae bacterium]